MRPEIAVALIAAAATITVAIIGANPSLFRGTEVHQLEPIAVETPSEVAAIPVAGTAREFQIFSEDFEDPNRGWPFDRTYFLDDGALHILADGSNNDVHPFINTAFVIGRGPYSLAARAGYVAGPDWSFGLVLKAFGKQDFLFVSIRETGYYRLTRLQGESWQDLTEWKAIGEQPDAWVTLAITNTDVEGKLDDLIYGDPESADDKLHLYVNDEKVAEIDNYLRGEALQFGVFSTLNIHAAFDDLQVNDLSHMAEETVEGACIGWSGQC